MFGLTFEKLFLVAVIAGVVIGPQRLPIYAQKLAETIRGLRSMVETARSTAEQEMGVSLQRAEWDLRQYDPRRIVQDALKEDPAVSVTTSASTELLAEASRVRPGQKYLISGSSAHPQRILIESLPPDDPRRLAARLTTSPEVGEDTASTADIESERREATTSASA
ncbi:MAG: hypothetical protein QM655_03925 [Nocardioidaceae bacterium]